MAEVGAPEVVTGLHDAAVVVALGAHEKATILLARAEFNHFAAAPVVIPFENPRDP